MKNEKSPSNEQCGKIQILSEEGFLLIKKIVQRLKIPKSSALKIQEQTQQG